MHVQRAIAGTLVTVSVIVLVAIGQDERSPEQENAQPQVTNCQTAMPVILKQYNNARYAVRAARNSGDRGHILTEVNQAQAALDAMEQPLKLCSEAMQSMKRGQPRDGKN
jgi:hypothetical protein